MNKMVFVFLGFVIYPLTLAANDGIDTSLFDELPIAQSEINQVTNLFWNAQSIQDNIKQSLPGHVRQSFTRASNGNGCNVQSVTKTEGSADACELNDDPNKMGKFVYNFSLSCNFGNYQVSVCSREESKLLNQLNVTNPEKLVSDDSNLFDLDSTM